MTNNRPLYRSRTNAMVGGVCAGIADYFDVDVTIVRIVVAIVAISGWGSPILAYVIMWIVVPEEPVGGDQVQSPAVTSEVPPTDAPPAPEAGASPVAPTDTPPAPPADMPSSAAAEPTTSWAVPNYSYDVGANATITKGISTVGVFIGIMFVVFGAFALVGQVLPTVSIWNMWPLFLVVIGLFSAVRPDSETGRWGIDVFFSGLSTVAFGVALLGCTTGWVSWRMWIYFIQLWPVLLIAGGIAVISAATKMRWVSAGASILMICIVAFAAMLAWQSPIALPFMLINPLQQSPELNNFLNQFLGHWSLGEGMI